MLYTTDSSGNLKSFNLLNVSDVFATARDVSGSEEYYFYTEDMRGSTVNLLDETGGGVVSYWYDDFGSAAEVKASGYTSFVNEIQYTGAIYDELTGLLYLNARFYDPSTGRFITQDTYRGERNNADTWHLYAYCANNPINFVDSSGHATFSIGIKTEAAAILGGYVFGAINFDKKNISVTVTKGIKIITNVAASISLTGIYSSANTVKDLIGFGLSTGLSFAMGPKFSGNVGISPATGTYIGTLSGSVGVGISAAPVPYWDTEVGYTSQIALFKKNKVSKNKKTYKVGGKKISIQRKGKYVVGTFSGQKKKAYFYDNGKVLVK